MNDRRRVIVTLPTYDEAENVESLTLALLGLSPHIEVLVADDDSPDGTWRIVQRMAQADPRVHLLHRTTDRGRGRAGRDAFVAALERGADAVLEMDADFSHAPDDVPRLLAALEDADLVIGSRLVAGGGERGRGRHRTWLTGVTSLFTRTLLRLPVRDCHSGFRLYRREALEAIDPASLRAVGPEIVPEVLDRAARAGLRIAEVPIHFEERRAGSSQLTLRKLLGVLRFTVSLALRRRTTPP